MLFKRLLTSCWFEEGNRYLSSFLENPF